MSQRHNHLLALACDQRLIVFGRYFVVGCEYLLRSVFSIQRPYQRSYRHDAHLQLHHLRRLRWRW